MNQQFSKLFTIINTLLSALSIYINPQNGTGHILSVPDEIRNSGYPVESHSVTTLDGYILEVHRIPYSPESRGERNKPVVFLQHGIGSCSAEWIFSGLDRGFGYILADLGYDVWLGNVRGNTYSRNHTTLDPDSDRAFWNFSFHEQGVFDLPATIDYILGVTGQPNLFYVGFSQGSTQFFVMASERPEYNDKIRAMFSFAPVFTIAEADTPVARLTQALSLTPKQAEDALGIGEIFRHSPLYHGLAKTLCSSSRVMQVVCETALFAFIGFDREQLDMVMIFPEIAKHFPSGASSKQVLHYLQGLSSAKFRQYDYGRRSNLLRYGTEQPPEYNTSKITAPVAIHYGENDWMASTKEVELFFKQLVNPIGKFLVPFPKFNHFDFLYAKDAKTLLYNRVTDLMTLF